MKFNKKIQFLLVLFVLLPVISIINVNADWFDTGGSGGGSSQVIQGRGRLDVTFDDPIFITISYTIDISAVYSYDDPVYTYTSYGWYAQISGPTPPAPCYRSGPENYDVVIGGVSGLGLGLEPPMPGFVSRDGQLSNSENYDNHEVVITMTSTIAVSYSPFFDTWIISFYMRNYGTTASDWEWHYQISPTVGGNYDIIHSFTWLYRTV
jgi:hypothetical protein